MTYDCRICVCVFFYSFFKTFFHRKRNQKAVRSRFDESVLRSAQRTKRKISSFLSLHFYPRKSNPSDIIAQKCFPSLPLLSSFLRPARTRYEILFPSFSLCFPFFAFFASKRFALRRFVLFLSLARIDFSQAGESQVAKVWIVIARSFTRPLYLSFFARVSSRQRQRRISPFLVYSLFSTK